MVLKTWAYLPSKSYLKRFLQGHVHGCHSWQFSGISYYKSESLFQRLAFWALLTISLIDDISLENLLDIVTFTWEEGSVTP